MVPINNLHNVLRAAKSSEQLIVQLIYDQFLRTAEEDFDFLTTVLHLNLEADVAC